MGASEELEAVNDEQGNDPSSYPGTDEDTDDEENKDSPDRDDYAVDDAVFNLLPSVTQR